MALQKQPISIPFAMGMDTKTDKNQVQIGKFLSLQNSVFDTLQQLTKRNGYGLLPNNNSAALLEQTTLTTLNGNLIATGQNLLAYNSNSNDWLNQGTIQPVQLSTISLVRNSTSQKAQDIAITANGLSCLVYTDASVAYYHLIDSATGYQVVQRTAIASNAANPRVFQLGMYFIIMYMEASTLNYIAIPINNPTSPSPATVFSSSVSGINAGYDGVVFNNMLYMAWAGSAGDVRVGALTAQLAISSTSDIAGHTATLMSITADVSIGLIYISFYDGTSIYSASFTTNLVPIASVTTIVTTTINEITSSAIAGILTIVYEVANTYGFTPASGATTAKTDYVEAISVTGSTTLIPGTAKVIVRGVGLASKAFINESNQYVMATFGETNQYTYFLIDLNGNCYMRLAATNGGGYETSQVLPSINFVNGKYYFPYLYADFLAAVNTGQNGSSNQTAPINAIYTQLGVNLAIFSLNDSQQYSSEIAGALHLTGGQLWEYDGVKPVEHGFQVYPSPNTATNQPNGAVLWSTTGGSIVAQPTGYVSGQNPYYYQFCYEWTDNQGNLNRSVPSIPISVATTGTGTTGSNTIYVPTLRITYKVGSNPVRIVGYRWSVAQQVYYQFTSLTSPTLNDTTVDYVTFVDTQSDSSILGNTILYTTGGVVENTAAPPSIDSTLYQQRLFLIDAEDQNLLWYSKQVIEATPVEMSDLFTIYVAPTAGAQGSTGPMSALSVMDDKLVIFKANACYYMTGVGPDNTGANNDFSAPIFITSSVGTTNPNSIVLMPNGLMFQSEKGIWLLGRDLSTNYIGAPVEAYNSNKVMSAQNIPGTNQIRFVLDNNVTLMYDYYVGQWGIHTNQSAISSTLYQNTHTYLTSYGTVLQETQGKYLDNTTPVLMSFTTSWINIAGLQGYERFYFMYLLGTYISPFKLNVELAYDYNANPMQSVTVSPETPTPNWGGDAVWGSSSEWGGTTNIFTSRIFPSTQKCSSFQVTVNELYDSSYGITAGQGLTLSGMNLIVGTKKGYRTQSSLRSFG